MSTILWQSTTPPVRPEGSVLRPWLVFTAIMALGCIAIEEREIDVQTQVMAPRRDQRERTIRIPVAVDDGRIRTFEVDTDTFQFDEQVFATHKRVRPSLFDQAQAFCEAEIPKADFLCADTLESQAQPHLLKAGRPTRLTSSQYSQLLRESSEVAPPPQAAPKWRPSTPNDSSNRALLASLRELAARSSARPSTHGGTSTLALRRALGKAMVLGLHEATREGELAVSSVLEHVFHTHVRRIAAGRQGAPRPHHGSTKSCESSDGGDDPPFSGVAFVHVSRSAGSSVCDLAWRNGCLAPGGPNREDNCASRTLLRDGPMWFRVGNFAEQRRFVNATSPGGRAKIMALHNWTFISIENYLEPSFFESSSRGLFTVIIIRRPLDRIKSHHRFLSTMLQRREIVMDFLNGSGPMPLQGDPSLTLFTEYAQVIAPFDNVATRVLSRSARIFWGNFGSVAKEDLETAKDALRRFDLVLSFDGLADGRLEAALRGSLGWSGLPNSLRRVRKSVQVLAASSEQRLSDDELALLTYVNRYDEELHEYAVMLFEMDHAVFSSECFQQPPLATRIAAAAAAAPTAELAIGEKLIGHNWGFCATK